MNLCNRNHIFVLKRRESSIAGAIKVKLSNLHNLSSAWALDIQIDLHTEAMGFSFRNLKHGYLYTSS